MKLRETMICWNPAIVRKSDQPWGKAGPHPARDGWDQPHLMSDGACFLNLNGGDGKGWREVSADERLLRLFVMFAIMTTRDGVPPAEVHNAFLAIDECREALPLDARTAGRRSVT